MQLLLLLEQGELTVSELMSVVQLPQSTVSRHLKVLADDEWVVSRASGRTHYYRMAPKLDDAAIELWALVRPDIVAAGLAEDDQVRAHRHGRGQT